MGIPGDARLVAGPTAYAWWRAARWSMLSTLVGGVGLLVFGVAEHVTRRTSAEAGWLVGLHIALGFFLLGALGVHLFVWGQTSKQRRETVRGYTTMPRERTALDVIDARSGLVMRAAQEPALRTRADVRAARAVVRADGRGRARELKDGPVPPAPAPAADHITGGIS